MVSALFVLSVHCVVVLDDYSAIRVSVHGHNMCGAVLDECCGADVLDCIGVGCGELRVEDDLCRVCELENTVPIREPDVSIVLNVWSKQKHIARSLGSIQGGFGITQL